MNEQAPSKHDQVLFSLVVNLQMMAMAQMGKIQDQATGAINRNLEQAAATIDILEMLKVKCRTDTPSDLLDILDRTVADLQLNYVDEAKKEQDAGAESDAETEADADAGTKTDEGAEADGDSETGPETPADGDTP